MRFAPRFTVVVVVAIATGCTAPVGSAAPEPVVTSTSGALTVDWTVKGTTDPNACTEAAATAIEITVVDSSNQRIGSYQQSCSAFATSITLEAGIYLAEARLLDAVGAPRTTNVFLDRFTIYGKSELTTPIDFPATAFLIQPN